MVLTRQQRSNVGNPHNASERVRLRPNPPKRQRPLIRLRRARALSIASLSSIDEDLDSNEEEEEPEEEEEEEPEEELETPEFEPSTLETRVILGKRAIIHSHASSVRFYFENFYDAARQRASEAADKLKKDTQYLVFEVSAKWDTRGPGVGQLSTSVRYTEFNDQNGHTGGWESTTAIHKRARSDAPSAPRRRSHAALPQRVYEPMKRLLMLLFPVVQAPYVSTGELFQ
jgi:hypothetical protein